MKINISILSVFFCLILTGCSSDELTKNKAEAIVKKCNNGENIVQTKTVSYGIVEVEDILKSKFPEKMKPYQKYSEMGLMKIDTLEKGKGIVGEKDRYEISLTPNAKSHLLNSEEGFRGQIKGKVKICEYKFDGVKEIQEIPERNEANVKIVFTRINETPFFEDKYQKRNPDEVSKTVIFRKTNEGWELCD